MDARQYGNRPAFPHAAMTEQVTVPTQFPGMTVREVFAGLALQGYLAGRNQHNVDSNRHEVARACVGYADALVAELAKDGA